MKKSDVFRIKSVRALVFIPVLLIGLAFAGCPTSTDSKPKVPAAPKDLTFVTKTDRSISVMWNTVDGAVNYHVYAGTTAGNLSLRGSPQTAFYQIE